MATEIRLSQQHSCSFDHLVGAAEQCQRDCDAERLCCFEIYDQLDLRSLHDRQVSWFFAL